MIEIWMKKLLSDNKSQHCKIYNAQMFLQDITNSVKFTFSVGDSTQGVCNE